MDYNARERPKYYTIEIWKELAKHFVPEEILSHAISFSRDAISCVPPVEIREKYPPKYPYGLIELEWNSITKEWIDKFISELEKRKELSDSQRKNARENITKAMALFVEESWDEDTWDDEEYEEEEERGEGVNFDFDLDDDMRINLGMMPSRKV